jgi:hypothetical protein
MKGAENLLSGPIDMHKFGKVRRLGGRNHPLVRSASTWASLIDPFRLATASLDAISFSANTGVNAATGTTVRRSSQRAIHR